MSYVPLGRRGRNYVSAAGAPCIFSRLYLYLLSTRLYVFRDRFGERQVSGFFATRILNKRRETREESTHARIDGNIYDQV